MNGMTGKAHKKIILYFCTGRLFSILQFGHASYEVSHVMKLEYVQDTPSVCTLYGEAFWYHARL